ncbi:MAG TPA: efflux transporter outer membrane subunit [Rhizobacter sp.]|nr:efflux transporter outer membrane subunit [Rhizobacter sp.]
MSETALTSALSRFALACAVPLGAGLLGACMSMAPHYERPAAPVPAAFADPASAPAASTPAANDIEWQSHFNDERLKRLIAIALNNNRDLRVAVLNIEQARAQYQIRRADLLPSVNAAVNGQRQTQPTSLLSVYTAGLAVTAYEVDLFGRVRSLSNAALAQYFGTEEARKSAQISLVAAVATAYYSVLADDALLEVTRQTLGTREEAHQLTQLKFDNGASSELDYRQSESLLEGARVTLQQTIRQRALDQNALALLLGQSLPGEMAPAPPDQVLLPPTLLPELPAGLPSEVLVRRPDVRQAEQQLIAANANIGAARAAFFPRILLTGSAGIASTELSGLFNNNSGAWSFLPSLTLPIFDAGRNRANLEVAKVNRDIAVAQYEKTIQTAFREVSDALAGQATLGEQVRAQLAQTRAEAARFKLADLRYRNGASSYLDVLDAQRSLFLAQQASVQVQAAQVQNQVTLYKVLGGGWKNPAATP